MSDSGDILNESQGDLENSMAIRPDPTLKGKKEDTDNPMWLSSSSGPMDWFYTD